jgi:hypothetical protein
MSVEEVSMSMFAVMRMQKWENMGLNPPYDTCPLKTPRELGVGFMVLFESREDAEKHAGGYQVVEVRAGKL